MTELRFFECPECEDRIWVAASEGWTPRPGGPRCCGQWSSDPGKEHHPEVQMLRVAGEVEGVGPEYAPPLPCGHDFEVMIGTFQ
jgi:hypothetical protein